MLSQGPTYFDEIGKLFDRLVLHVRRLCRLSFVSVHRTQKLPVLLAQFFHQFFSQFLAFDLPQSGLGSPASNQLGNTVSNEFIMEIRPVVGPVEIPLFAITATAQNLEVSLVIHVDPRVLEFDLTIPRLRFWNDMVHIG